jgi:hypothetical protein
MNLEMNDGQTEALIRELDHIVRNDRYPLSPRIVAPKQILERLRRQPRAPAGAPTEALRAAEQGSVYTATRLGPPVHSSGL